MHVVLAVTLFVSLLWLISIGRLGHKPPPRTYSLSSTAGIAHERLLPLHFVSWSSDDWGRSADAVPLYRSLFVREHLWAQAGDSIANLSRGTPWTRATLDTPLDLRRLRATLQRLNAGVAHPRQRVVLSPMWVVGGPDIQRMQQQMRARTSGGDAATRPTGAADADASRSACNPNDSLESPLVYHEVLLRHRSVNGERLVPGRDDLEATELVSLYLDLWHERLWHPEYHGRSHFHVRQWLQELAAPDGPSPGISAVRPPATPSAANRSTASPTTISPARTCLQHGCVCGSTYAALRSEFSTDDHALDRPWLAGGLRAFRQFWGYAPRVMSSPHNTWSLRMLRELEHRFGVVGVDLGSQQARWLRWRLRERCRSGRDPRACGSQLSLLDRVRADAFYQYEYRCGSRTAAMARRARMHAPGFTALMWHAQNALGATYTYAEHRRWMRCFERTVEALRRLNHTVMVTASELHQLRRRGWSREVWADALVFRNARQHDVWVRVPCLERLYDYAEEWCGRVLHVKRYPPLGVSEWSERPSETLECVCRPDTEQQVVGEETMRYPEAERDMEVDDMGTGDSHTALLLRAGDMWVEVSADPTG